MTNFLRSILKVFACYKTSAFFPISTPSLTRSSKLILAHRKEGRFFIKRAFKLNLGWNGEKWFGDLRIDRTNRKARECSRDRRRLSEGGFQRVPVSEELLPSPSRLPSLSLFQLPLRLELGLTTDVWSFWGMVSLSLNSIQWAVPKTYLLMWGLTLRWSKSIVNLNYVWRILEFYSDLVSIYHRTIILIISWRSILG